MANPRWREISEFDTQFARLTEFDTQFISLSKFDIGTANSFSLGVSHLFSPIFSLLHFLSLSRPDEKTKMPLSYLRARHSTGTSRAQRRSGLHPAPPPHGLLRHGRRPSPEPPPSAVCRLSLALEHLYMPYILHNASGGVTHRASLYALISSMFPSLSA